MLEIQFESYNQFSFHIILQFREVQLGCEVYESHAWLEMLKYSKSYSLKRAVVFNPSPGDPSLCMICMSLLSETVQFMELSSNEPVI